MTRTHITGRVFDKNPPRKSEGASLESLRKVRKGEKMMMKMMRMMLWEAVKVSSDTDVAQ